MITRLSILKLNLQRFFDAKHGRERPGFCVDYGAPSSAIGIKEVRRIYSRFSKQVPSLKNSRNRFRSADATFDSIGTIEIPLATSRGVQTIFIIIMDVVSAYVPALVGLDIFDFHDFKPETATNHLMKRDIFRVDEHGN